MTSNIHVTSSIKCEIPEHWLWSRKTVLSFLTFMWGYTFLWHHQYQHSMWYHNTFAWRHQCTSWNVWLTKYLNIDSGLGKRSLPVTNRFVQTGNSVLKKIVGSICCLEKKIIIWRMWNCFKNVKYRVNSKITSFIVERWFMWCFSNKVFWGFVFELRSGQLSYEAGFL
jgi:hypothetical protein